MKKNNRREPWTMEDIVCCIITFGLAAMPAVMFLILVMIFF